MIKLEMLKSADFVQSGNFLFHQDYIFLGSSHDSHIVLQSSSVEPTHLMIFEDQSGFFIKSSKSSFHLGGKLCKGVRPLRLHDIFSIGDYEFKVLELVPSSNKILFADKSDLYKKAISDSDLKDELLAKIETELIRIEDKMKESYED